MQPTEAAQIAGTPTNLPLALVIASDAWLAAHARADAHDIAITLGDGTTELDYERVAWNNGTGALEVWLKDPAPESGDSYYIYYGDADQAADRQDATGVWSNSYDAAWHLGEADAVTTMVDSTGARDGTAKGAGEPAQVAGQVGYGQSFDSDYIDYTPSSPGSYICVEAWVNFASVPGADVHIVHSHEDGVGARFDFYYNDGVELKFYDVVLGASVVETWTPSTATWYYIVGKYDGSTGRLYIDAIEVDTGAMSTAAASPDMASIGSHAVHGEYFPGSIDEVRISTVDRSANWITTCHNNQKSPAPGGTFWSALGSEEKESRYPAVVFQCPAIV